MLVGEERLNANVEVFSDIGIETGVHHLYKILPLLFRLAFRHIHYLQAGSLRQGSLIHCDG